MNITQVVVASPVSSENAPHRTAPPTAIGTRLTRSAAKPIGTASRIAAPDASATRMSAEPVVRCRSSAMSGSRTENARLSSWSTRVSPNSTRSG